MGFKRFGALMLGAVTLCVGLIACGPAATGGAAQNSPIVIGVVCSCTGALASSVEVGPPAYQAWASYQNAHGGLNGHQIKVIVKDDAASPATSLSEVTSMVTGDHIAVLVDDSNADTAFATYIDSQHIPVIGGGSQSDVLLTDSNFFAPGQTVDDYFVNYMEAAKKVGVKNIAQLYCAESPICQQGVAPFKATAKAEGITAGYVSSISFSSPSYTAECLAAKQAGVQIMNVADAVTVVQHVASDCLKQGYTPWQLALDGGVSQAFASSPGIENKFIGSEPDIPFFSKIAPVKTMNAALKKYANAKTLGNPNYNEEAVQNWVSGLLLADAVKKSNAGSKGPITPAQIYKGLYAMHGDTLNGMAPPLTFKQGQPNPVHCWFWIRIQNNKFTTPYGTAPVCKAPVKG
jgi:branched-chain amino acid transport system substrate-binding protein